ncbi:MAG: transglutaminase domain-containing protein [Polyangiales bacterium]
MMRRGVVLVAAMALPLLSTAQEPSARLHRNLPASYPFEALPRGVVVPPMNRDDLRQASADTSWRESRRPGDEILRPREAWTSATRELDANTRSPAGARLSYREVFAPSVSPFKRTQAFDAVDSRGRLFVRNPLLRPLSVGPGAARGEGRTQRFTGDVNLEVSPERPTPLPSVAGESVVVGYRTTPQVSVAFFQDSAGNLFVRGERVATVRLTWVLEAPEGSFVPTAIPAVPVEQVATRLGVAAPTAPAFLRADAPAVLRHFEVGPERSLDVVLDRLTARFRAFRDADLPAPPSGSLFRALATGGVGACRHRAYAFALTLMALGVPARFVGNEAHAWVEVQIPGNGWTRIDLGGWDVPLQEQGHGGAEPFVPERADPFPRPPEYANGYSTRGASPSPGPRAAAPAPEPVAEAPGEPAASPSPGARVAASGAAPSRPGGPPEATASAAVPGADDLSAPARPRGAPGETEAPTRSRTTLRLEEVSPVAGGAPSAGFVRGTLVRCVGEALDDELRPIADLSVQVELLRDGVAVQVDRGARRSGNLGSTATGPDGRFEARVLLPVELGAGSYELRVRTPGDARHLPARSE